MLQRAEDADADLIVSPNLPSGRRPELPETSAIADPRRLRLRLWAVYSLAGVTAGVVLTIFYFAIEDVDWSPVRGFMIAYIFCWPLAPTMAALLERSRFATLRFALTYSVIGALVMLLWSSVTRFGLGHSDVHPLGNVLGYAQILVSTAGAPFTIVLLSGTRRLRPVVPLVLAGLLLFSFAALGLQSAFVRVIDIGSLRDRLVGIGYTPLFMIASLPVGYICWLALRWLARRYQTKGYSDIQLLVDAWWLTAVFSACTSLATQIGWRALWALVAFAAYRIVVGVGLTWWRISSSEPTPSRLLLLRVFGAPRRAEKLFDAVAARWRFDGNVNMIGGADLAARTVDPGEMLSFVGGQLQSHFVRDSTDLARRLDTLDETRDPDGRFRVNEFFCFDDTWRAALEELLTRSDLVLMDLRGFSGQNAGVLFEVQKLVERDRLGRTLFVVDHASDEDLLHTTVSQAVGQLGVLEQPALEIARVTRLSGADLRRVSASLRALTGPQNVSPATT